jgi:DUF4097 and DUF4098 domain-containing protein YvlB
MKFIVALFLSAGLNLSPSFFQSDEAVPQDKKQSFKVQPGGTLNLDVAPGNIELTPWDKNEVLVEVEGLDDEDGTRLKITQEGNTIKVRYKNRSRRSGDVDFRISLPKKFNSDLTTSGGNVLQHDELVGSFILVSGGGKVRLETLTGNADVQSGGGDIRIKKIDGDGKVRTGGGTVDVALTTGTLSLETGGGNAEAEKVLKNLKLVSGGGNITVGEVGGEADVSTGGGNLHVGTIASNLKLSSGGGNVVVKGASGKVELTSGGGNLTVEKINGSVSLTTGGGNVSFGFVPSGAGFSKAKSGGGDITVYLPENAKATIDALIKLRVSRGSRKRYDIRSDFKATDYQKNDDDDRITGTYTLNGGGERVTLETTNGDIEIRKMK